MKSCLLVFAVFAVTQIYGEIAHIFDPQQENAVQYAMECIKETGVGREIMIEFKKGNIIEDAGLKKFMLCFYKEADIVNENGHVIIEKALPKLPQGVDKEESKKLLEICNKEIGKDPADTAFKIYMCYSKNTA